MSNAAPAAGAAASASEGTSQPNAAGTPQAGENRSRAGEASRNNAAGAASDQRKPLPGRPEQRDNKTLPGRPGHREEQRDARPDQKKPEPAQKKPEERQAAKPETEKKPADDKPKQRFKVKVDGQETEVELDELLRGYSHTSAANKRMAEAAEIRTKADADAAALHAAKTGDFRPLVEAVGLEAAEKFAVDFVEQLAEWQGLPEEQRRLKVLERENQAYKDRDQAEQDRKAQEAAQQRAQKAEQDLDVEIGDLLRASGKKATPRIVMRIAEEMYAALESSKESGEPNVLSAKDAYTRVQAEIRNDIAEYVADLPVAELRKILPPTVLEALRKSDLETAQAQDPFRSGRRESSPPIERPRRDAPKLGTDAWLKAKEDRFKKTARR